MTQGLTKTQAIHAMANGHKVSHKYFDESEWVRMIEGRYFFEDGVNCAPHIFWQYRTTEQWETGWSIFKANE
jgi:hypothetical protein